MFGFKKKKKTVEVKKENIDQVSSTKIKVKVFSSLGGDLRVLKASYNAIEQRNDFGELVSINDGYKHDEDVNFYMDSIYREMQILLDFRSKDKKQKKDILDKKIRKQEKLIYFLDHVNELNAFYNYQDELAKLRDYRVLRNYLKLDSHGSYFYIENGIRTYEFDAIDGFLIPRWHGNDTYSSYPDHTRTKKIKIQEDYIFQKEMANRRFDLKLLNYGAIFFIINMVIAVGLFGGGFYAYMKIDDKYNALEQSSIVCTKNLENVNTQFSGIIKDTFDFRKKMLAQNVTLVDNQVLQSERGNNLIEKSINTIT